MGAHTNIEWTDTTWNPVTGCTKVSEGCRNCYIERTPPFRMAGRTFVNGTTGVMLHPDRLAQPLHWKKSRTIFLSLSDLFHEDVPDEFIERVFHVMHDADWHIYQVLTKRPSRMRMFCTAWMAKKTLAEGGPEWHWPYIWLGVSCEDQRTADERIPLLLQTPAAVRFVSAEPLLGPINLRSWLPATRQSHQVNKLDWVIIGGESGPHARGTNVAHIRSLVHQCQRAKVPVFVKQLGSIVGDRNDAGFEGDTPTSWPMDTITDDEDHEMHYQGAGIRIRLKDRKGGDPAEWPEDLRVREVPE